MDGGAKTTNVGRLQSQPKSYMMSKLPPQQINRPFKPEPKFTPKQRLQEVALGRSNLAALKSIKQSKGSLNVSDVDILNAVRKSVQQGVIEDKKKSQETFFTRVLGDEVTEKGKAIDVLTNLAYFDSIHDFWKERGKKKTVTGEDEDTPEEIDETRLQKVKDRLVQTIQKYTGISGSIESILAKTTNSGINTTTSIEDRVLDYFKKKYPPFNEPEVTITVNEILTNWKFGKDYKTWDDYRSAILKLPTNVAISLDGKFIKSLETNELGYIGFFILAFLNPEVNPGQSDVNLTFDMIPRDIGRIFDRFTQVKNAIYPQNVADSATTSFTALQGRSVFFRANYTPSDGSKEPIIHVARSNAFSRDKYDIAFVDEGFSTTNRLGFSLYILGKDGSKKAVIPFGKGKEQGPSVNYLMDLLSADDPSTVRPKLDKVAVFTQLKEIDPDLLFDIKRLGDQEQMLVDTAYGVTGDRFAGAFRRLLRKPGIFHSSKGFRLWRGGPPVDAVESARQFRRTQVIAKLQLVSGTLSKASSIYDELLRMKEHVEDGVNRVTVFSDLIPVAGKLTPDYIYDNYTKIASTFATYLLRERFRDISEQISSLIAKIDAIRVNPDIKTASCVADPPPQAAPVDANACPPLEGITPEIIDSSLDKLEEFIKSIKELEDINIPIFVNKEGVDAGPIYVELFDKDTGRLLKGVSSEYFNVSTNAFLHPETGFAPSAGRLLALSRSSQLETVADQINKLLVQYFQSRDEIKEAFFNAETKANVEAITDITSGIDARRIMTLGAGDGAQGLLDVIQTVAAAGETVYGVPPEVVAQQGGAQSGGAGSHLQFRDLHDLFVEICLEAYHAIVIEKDPMKALDDIEVKWVIEVDQNRMHAVDYYGVEFEETDATNMISYFLSFRSNRDPLFEIAANSPIRSQPWFNFIAEKLTGKEKVEEYILNALVNMGSDILGVAYDVDEQGQDISFAAPEVWRTRIPTILQTYSITLEPAREVQGLIGGGLEASSEDTSNAEPSSSTSRRNLYAGLRKQSGSGSNSEL